MKANCSNRNCLNFVVVLLSMAMPDQSHAQAQFSVGPKASYRFESGWEGGFELSYIPDIVNPLKGFYGFTFDIIPSGKTKSVHLGAEVMAIMGGVDVGPTFFWGSDHASLGVSVIVFTGVAIYPFFELDVFSKNDSLVYDSSVGGYLKFPIYLSGEQRNYFH